MMLCARPEIVWNSSIRAIRRFLTPSLASQKRRERRRQRHLIYAMQTLALSGGLSKGVAAAAVKAGHHDSFFFFMEEGARGA